MRPLLFLLAFLTLAAADPAVALIQKYGWSVEGQPTVTVMDVPESLTGLPFTHYQSASESIGFDLTPAQGMRLSLQRYTLTKRTKSGAHLFAHVALLEGRIVGAWLSTDAPVAPGISPLSDRKMGSNW
jgi:hypothetical protein